MMRLGLFHRDRRGVSAVEFAIIAPVLILAYFGLAELCGAMLAERKASHAASAIGDLVAQESTVGDADMANIFAASSIVMSPDSTSTFQAKVSSIQADSTGANYKVLWSSSYGGMAADPNGAVTDSKLSNLIGANQSIIRSVVTYTYNVPVAYMLPAAFTYTDTFYLRPRIVDPIPRTSP